MPDIELELIIVESNSTDGTRADRPEVRRPSPGVTVVFEEVPRGKGPPCGRGLERASGDVVLIQDGDLEYSVDDYPSLLEPIEAGPASFVLGSRHVNGQPMRYFEDSRSRAGGQPATGSSPASSTPSTV